MTDNVSGFSFKAKKLILVDSTGFSYLEVPLTENSTLLAKGNVGKTSSLNALLLFMLPEVNFKDCERKFGFVGADGYHDRYATYDYYFPSNQSFIILESEVDRCGSKQSHCHIIHRHSAADSSFSHIFTSLDYDQIRGLFWDTFDPEMGIGSRVEELTHQSVFTSLKGIDKHAVQTRDRKRIQSLIFNNDIMSTEAMRYSVFPLSKNDDGQIESFRAISKLLFNMKTGDDTVADAVAHIIEADKKTKNDELVFDIDGFMGLHKELNARQDRFTLIDNLQPEFQSLLHHRSAYEDALNNQQRFVTFSALLSEKISEKNELLEEYSHINGLNVQAKKLAQEKMSAANADYAAAKKATKRCDASLREHVAGFNKGDLLFTQLPNKTVDEVIEWYTGVYNETEKLLAGVKDVTQGKIELKKEEEHLLRLNMKRRKLELDRENHEHRLDKQLSSRTKSVLNAVSSKIVLANPSRELDDAVLQKIEDFACLFGGDSPRYELFGTMFYEDAQLKDVDYEHELTEVAAEIRVCKGKIKRFKASQSDSIKQSTTVEEVTKLLEGDYDNLQAVTEYKYHERRVNDLTIELEVLQKEERKALEVQESCKLKLTEKEALFAESRSTLDEVKNVLVELNKLSSAVGVVHSNYPALSAIMPDTSMEMELSVAVLSEISTQLNSIGEHRSAVYNIISSKFLYNGVIAVNDEIRSNAPTWEALNDSINELDGIYTNLESQRQVLVDQVRQHNETAQSYSNVLVANKEYISRFANSLNNDFKDIQINDLTAIEIEIQTDKRFGNLVADIGQMDFYQDKMLSERFYQRLEAFSAEFFGSDSHAKLTMNNIITKISYRVKKAGGPWETKGQSNSTTSLINLKLVQILLRRLITPSCSISYPLVLDEAANVSTEQFDWLLQDANDAGFNMLFAATHSLAPEVIAKIGTYHVLDSMKTGKPYHPDRAMVYFNGGESLHKIKSTDSMRSEEQLDFGSSLSAEALD